MRKAFWNSALKLSLIGLALVLLHQKVDWNELRALEIKASTLMLWQATVGFLLLFALNLSLDALSWKTVQGILRSVTLKEAFLHNLKAYALAFITPFNSGELAGRYLAQRQKEHRQKTLYLTFWAHAPKLFSKASVGFPLAFFVFIPNSGQSLWLIFLALAYALLLFSYFKLEKVLSFFEKRQIRERKLNHYLVKGRPFWREKLKLLLVNALRFLCFSGQMALVLTALDPALLNLSLLASLPVYYFLTAIIPTWAAFDFLVKSVLSLFFFAFLTDQEILFALASAVVWLFNVAVPALTGLALFNPAELKTIKVRRN
mgnify:FL=1